MKLNDDVRDCGLSGLTFTQPSLVKTQFADECDLGQIVKRFLKTGELPHFVDRPTISDATNIPDDFFEALRPAVEIRQAFDQLPLEVRNQYNNDPEAWFADEVVKHEKEQLVDKAAGKSEPVSPEDTTSQEPPSDAAVQDDNAKMVKE